uniref:Uncharacterized protein n=1 Tax=Strongyloides papillosus TaxID=174720 RepID=A0A0N5B743_STREA
MLSLEDEDDDEKEDSSLEARFFLAFDKLMDDGRILPAALRHLETFEDAERVDEESEDAGEGREFMIPSTISIASFSVMFRSSIIAGDSEEDEDIEDVDIPSSLTVSLKLSVVVEET